MLVLSRNPGQSIILDGNIKFTILERTGRQVRVGIEAPPEIKIFRDEFCEEDSFGNEAKERG